MELMTTFAIFASVVDKVVSVVDKVVSVMDKVVSVVSVWSWGRDC
jgi:hypothetical protein